MSGHKQKQYTGIYLLITQVYACVSLLTGQSEIGRHENARYPNIGLCGFHTLPQLLIIFPTKDGCISEDSCCKDDIQDVYSLAFVILNILRL